MKYIFYSIYLLYIKTQPSQSPLSWISAIMALIVIIPFFSVIDIITNNPYTFLFIIGVLYVAIWLFIVRIFKKKYKTIIKQLDKKKLVIRVLIYVVSWSIIFYILHYSLFHDGLYGIYKLVND